MSLTGNWENFHRDIATLESRLLKAIENETGKIAHAFTNFWINGIKTKSFGLDENSPLTKSVKGSSTPLIDHGDFINSIKAQKMQDKVWFCGINKNAKRKNQSGSGYGNALISIAEIMEYGTKGPIKPKGHPFLSIPLTRKASRVGSPRQYPTKLMPFIALNGSHGMLVDEKGDPQYLLVRMIKAIKPRPSMRIAYERFGPIAMKMWSEVVRREVMRNAA